MVEQGWLGVTVAEADGGLGLGVVELGVLLEELGRHVAPVPFLPTAVTIELARRAGADDLVAELVDGTRTACIAWSPGTASLRGDGDAISRAGPTRSRSRRSPTSRWSSRPTPTAPACSWSTSTPPVARRPSRRWI